MDGSIPSRLPRWEWRAAGNFTFGGTGGGLAVCAAASQLLTGDGAPFALLLAAALVGTGLGLMWRQARRPWRDVRALFRGQAPWADREAAIAAALAVALLPAAVFGGSLLSLLVLALGCGFLYAQARILQEAGGDPAWRVRQLVPLVLATGAAEGAGALAVVAALIDWSALPQAVRLAIVFMVVRWPVWTIYRDTVLGPSPDEATKREVGAFNTRFAVLALAAPAVALTAAVFVPLFGNLIAILGGALCIAGGWMLKYRLLAKASPAQGAAAEHMPVPPPTPPAAQRP